MHRTFRNALRALAFGIAILLGVALLSPAFAQNGGPIAAPPQSNPYGKSYGDWSAAWWQWAYSLPIDGHPLFDETGTDAGAGQTGHVWFLGGVFNVSGTAHRVITIPKGTALFFPILNVEWDNICPPTDPPLSNAELAAMAASFMDLVTTMACEVDGVSVPNLFDYRCTTGPFSVDFPENGLFQAFCGTPPGPNGPMMGDGYYLMIKPLPKGHHTLHFTGTVGPPVSFTLDITYDITVVDRNDASAAAALPMAKPALARAMASIRTPISPSTAAVGRASLAPNPTRSGGTLSFSLSKPGAVDVRLYDVSGRMVRVVADHQTFTAGAHQLRVDRNLGDPLAPGTYFYRVTTQEGKSEGRMIVLQ